MSSIYVIARAVQFLANFANGAVTIHPIFTLWKLALYIFVGAYSVLRSEVELALIICRQRHRCLEECQSLGNCLVETKPYSMEANFVGKHGRFQYTKVRVFFWEYKSIRDQCSVDAKYTQGMPVGPFVNKPQHHTLYIQWRGVYIVLSKYQHIS